MRHALIRSGVDRLALFLCLFLILIPAWAYAGSDPDAASIVQVDDDASLMDADECGPSLQPFSVSMMGSHITDDGALGVAIDGGYAYVADGLGGLQIVGISEPSSPALVATFDTPGYAEGVAIDGGYAYVADGPGGLQIIDISTPNAPQSAGECAVQGFAYGVAVKGDYAYIGGGGGGLQIVNVSDPDLPQLIGSYNVCSTTWGVAVKGNYVYVAGGSGGLQIVDITNPVSPALVGNYDTRSMALGVAVNGDFAYVAGGSSGLKMVSIADPASLMLIAKCPYPDFAYGLAVVNNYAYVAGGANGLQVMQVLASISVDDPPHGPPTGLRDLNQNPGTADIDRPYSNSLMQNLPNPFTSTTKIAFLMESAGPVRLNVFDARGRMVRKLVNERRAPSRYVEEWDGRDNSGRPAPAGIYFYKLQLSGWTDVKKMALAR